MKPSRQCKKLNVSSTERTSYGWFSEQSKWKEIFSVSLRPYQRLLVLVFLRAGRRGDGGAFGRRLVDAGLKVLLDEREGGLRIIRHLEELQVLGRNHPVPHEGVEVQDLLPERRAVE